MLARLFDAFADAKIRYCVLHGWQSLPEHLSSDLDMVVHPADLSTVEQILRNNTEARLVQLLQHEYSGFYFVLALRQPGDDRFILVDVATDYRRDWRIFFTAEELLAGRRSWKGLWVASPGVEFRYLLVKKVLKGSVTEHQQTRLRGLCEELGNEAVSSARRLFGKKYGDFIVSCIAASDWTTLESNLSRLRRAVLWQVVKREPFNPLRYFVAEMRRVWNRCRFPTGLFVAILGPDGAGKSTLIQSLQKNLTGAFRRTDAFHLRPMVLGKRITTAVTNPHGKPAHPWWLSLLKIPYFVLDYALGYLLKVRPRVTRSTLVLFDRYYDDLLVDPLRYRYRGPMSFASLARLSVPKPDLFIVLNVNEESVCTRKTEVSEKELRRQCDAYRKLAAQLPNAVLVDGSLSPNEVALDASEVILDCLRRRYLNRRHLWFGDDSSETLNWVQGLLFSSKQMRLRCSNSEASSKIGWSVANPFRWLSLKDGRGYLIPTDSRQTSFKALQLYNAQSLKAKWAKKMVSVGLKAGISTPLLRKFQTRDRQYFCNNNGKQSSLLQHFKEILQRDDITFAVSVGTPGAHRKPVLQVLTKQGQILGYAKLGWNESTNALVENEAGISRYLSGVSLNSFSVPSVLYSGWWNDHFLCIHSAPTGKIETAPQSLVSQYFSVLNELKHLHVRWLPLKESSFWTKLVRRSESIRNMCYRRVTEQGLCRAEESLSNMTLPFHFCHGDFTPWNAQLLNDRPFLFDWEYADSEGLPGWDLFHFCVQTSWLLEKKRPDDVHKTVMNICTDNHSRKFGFDSFNLEDGVIRTLFLLYILDRLSFYASDENGTFDKVRFFSAQAYMQL